MQLVTLLFLVKDNSVLLGLKKRDFGSGKWNGVGGKVEIGENPEKTAIRECFEEIGVYPKELNKVAIINFHIPSQHYRTRAYVYLCSKWEGQIVETEEMRPHWYQFGSIPYNQMWSDDQHWLPRVLTGEKIRAEFTFDETEQVIDQKIKPLDSSTE